MVETSSNYAWRMIGEKWHNIEAAENVFIGILSRLPVKSLLSSKAVCKYWRNAIRSESLVNMHLSQSKETPSYIVCPRVDDVMALYLMKPGEWISHYLLSITTFSNNSCPYMVCSFNGLICCLSRISENNDAVVEELEIRICNPATREILILPRGSPSFGIEPRVGVAYGPDVSEYKVFCIFCAKECSELRENDDSQAEGEFDGSVRTPHYECEVYMSSTGSWKSIGPVPEIPMPIAYAPYASGHVFVGERIYWLVASRDDNDIPGSVLSVDMQGNFKVLDMPRYSESMHADDRITGLSFLVNLEGTLSMVILHACYMDVWLFKGEDRMPLWDLEREESDFPFSAHEFFQFVTAWKNNLLFATADYWYTFELDSSKWRIRERCDDGLSSPVAFLYTESLLGCNGALNLEEGGRA